MVFFGYVGLHSQVYYDNGPLNPNGSVRAKSSNGNSSRFVLLGTSWASNTLTYFFKNEIADIAGTIIERNAIRDAFRLWSDFSPLTFVEGTSAANSDIVILWATGNHGDGANFDNGGGVVDGQFRNVLAHAFSPPSNGTYHDITGDMHFDDFETWTANFSANIGQPIDLVTVAVHEIGHALGLDHTNVAGALMAPAYAGSHRFLCLDDIQGIQAIYGAVTNFTAIQGPEELCTTANQVYTIDGVCDFSNIFWTSSSNIQRVAVNGNTVTVRRTSTGGGWIQANIDGVILRRNINLGLPATIAPATPTICTNIRGSVNDYLLPISPGAESYQLTSSSSSLRMNGTTSLSFTSAPFLINFRALVPGNYTVTIQTTNACGTSTASFPVRAEFCPGGGGNSRYSVFPNPASSEISIGEAKDSLSDNFNSGFINYGSESMTTDEPLTMEIYDFNGNLVRTKGFEKSTYRPSIDISDLKKGNYFIRVVGKEVDETHQIVLQ